MKVVAQSTYHIFGVAFPVGRAVSEKADGICQK